MTIPIPCEELFIGMELAIGHRASGRDTTSANYFEARVWWFNMIGSPAKGDRFTTAQKQENKNYRDWLRYWNEYCNWCRYTQKRGRKRWQDLAR